MRIPLPPKFTYGLLLAAYAGSVTFGATLVGLTLLDPAFTLRPMQGWDAVEGAGWLALAFLVATPALAFVVGLGTLVLSYGLLRRFGGLRAWVVVAVAGAAGALATGLMVRWDEPMAEWPLALAGPGALAGIVGGFTFWRRVLRHEASRPAPS